MADAHPEAGSGLIERAGQNGGRNPDIRMLQQKNTDARPVIRCHQQEHCATAIS
jgi:hypothetical protein